MNDNLIQKLCKYIYTNFRVRYKSNRDFALDCNVDEKTIRLIQQEKYNMSIKVLKQICDSQDKKLSDVLLEIGE